MLLCGITPGLWNAPERPWDFFDLKGYLESTADFFNRSFQLDTLESPAFQQGQRASIKLRKQDLGQLGKVDPQVARDWDLPENSYVFELSLDFLLAKPLPPAQFESIPQYPPALRDIALVVDKAVPAETIIKAAANAGGALLKAVNIFDVYSGKPLPPDKKSVALSLLFQSPERTLTDKDTQKAMDRVVNAVVKNCGAVLR
ncbi:MAG: hypothetical protein GX117_10095 [Candidatus Hydrogenedentes bacterium]|nr:hypothetical protein [Candidatus Hydrogenedentota bacterium]